MTAEALSAEPAAMPGTEHARRITIVSGLRIFPCQTGGHLRTGGIALALARLGHEVTLYSLAGRQSDYRLAAPVSGRRQPAAHCAQPG